MTREKAIIDLNALKFILDNDQYTDEIEEALDTAIFALQQPERKTGTWYEHYSHEDGERDGVRCSECGTHYYFDGQLMNYCPNCGADMREGD